MWVLLLIMSMPSHCQFFVQRKKRFCRMTVKNGNTYCGEHLPQKHDLPSDSDKDNKSLKRVACPLDPTHTCYASKISKHLKVCNVKQLQDMQPDYIVKGINSLGTNERLLPHVPLSQLDATMLDTILQKINTAHDTIPDIRTMILSHQVLKDELSNADYGRDTRKHLLQNASLIAHLEQANLLGDNTCFIEFGAGKGKLTYWLAQAIKEQKNSAVMLVDRSSHRHKHDNKLKNETNSLGIIRVRADIADLCLSRVPDIQGFEHKVGIAKHLCGVATDLTIRCLVQATESNPKVNVTGMIVAFCCHHRCEYSSYVGKHYLEKVCGFLPSEFSLLSSIASWATCGSGKSRIEKTSEDKCLDMDNYDRSESTKLEQREIMGRKVKTLLNWGRLEYMKSAGFNCELINYTSIDISPENMCMIATRKTA